MASASHEPGQKSASPTKAPAQPNAPRGFAPSPQPATLDPQKLTPTDVQRLQRAIGNRATTQLLRPVLQRPVLQRKALTLGAAGDRYEQEADRVAEQVARQVDHTPATMPRAVNGMRPKDAIQPKALVKRITPMHYTSRDTAQHTARPPRPSSAVGDVQRNAAQPTHGPEGGAVEQSVQQQIQHARGSGKALAPDLRAKLQRSFGADLGHVKIHTGNKADVLNRSLNARAFTVGNDIFFKRGEERNLKLNAHEITHTFQQTGGQAAGIARAQRDVIQRDLGFEYAISWNAMQREKNGSTRSYGKKHELFTAPDFNMETDGTEIEFVINPIKDTEGEAGIVRVFNQLEGFARIMEKERDRAQAKRGTTLLHPPLSFVSTHDPKLEIDTHGDDVKGVPQATIGVKMESVPALYQGLSDTKNKDNDELIGMNAGFSSHAAKIGRAVSYNWANVNGHPPGPKLKGLLAMVALVLNQGNAPFADAAAPTVKYLMILMSRTQFGHLFNQIEATEQQYFSQNPDAFVTYVCNTLNLNADANVITWKIHDGQNLQDKRGTSSGRGPFKKQGQDERISINIKRRAWLTEMTKGNDLLTAAANPITRHSKKQFQDTRGFGHRLRGLGGLGNTMDNLANGSQGAIMEMRVMKKPVPYQEWKEQAISIFRYVRALNDHNGAGAAPTYKRVNLKQEKQQKELDEAQDKRMREDSNKRRMMNFWG